MNYIENKKKDINSILSYSILAIITSIIVFFVIYNANWTWGDDYEFLISTAIGEIEWALHISNMGRFFPFGHFDYNILTLIPGGASPTAHYILVAISLVVFVIGSVYLYKIVLKEANRTSKFNSWFIALIVVFLLYYFNQVFFFLVYPERIMVVLLTLFALSYYRLMVTNKWYYAFFGILFAIYLSYCKETMFIFFTIVVSVNLLFGFKRLTPLQKIFFILLALNIIVFLLFYYFTTYRNTTVFYSRHSDITKLMPFTLGNVKLLYIALPLFFWRVFQFLFKKDRNNLFFDSLLFGGIIYWSAIMVLNLQITYYYFPSVMLVLPAMVYWTSKWFHPRWLIIVLLLTVVYYGRKFPAVITNIQELRLNTHVQVEHFTSLIKKAPIVYWFENSRIDVVNKGIQGYQKEITNAYVHYFDTTIMNINYKIIHSVPDSIPVNSVIIYSDLNIINQTDKDSFEKIMEEKNIRKMDYYTFVEQSVFQKEN